MTLDGLKVAILIEDGFEQVEMVEPRKALDDDPAMGRQMSNFGHTRSAIALAVCGKSGPRSSMQMAITGMRPSAGDAAIGGPDTGGDSDACNAPGGIWSAGAFRGAG